MPDDDAIQSDAEALAKIVLEAREAKGWSQDMAVEGIDRAEVSKIENAKNPRVKPDTVRRYSEALEIEPHRLPTRYLWPEALSTMRGLDFEPNWDHLATGRHASKETKRLLHSAHRFDCTAIDDGLLLLPSRPKLPLNKIPIVKLTAAPDLDLIDPKEQQLLSFPFDNYTPSIQEYLALHAKGGAKGNYQTKLGLAQIIRPVLAFGQEFRMEVTPLSYWTLTEFNRKLGTSELSSNMRKLKLDALLRLLENDDDLSFGFPSALYVEASVTTSDGKLLVVEKNSNLSAFAKSGRRWTTSIEEGLSWHYYVSKNEVDARSAIVKGLGRELDVQSADVKSTDFYGLGLELPSLNVGILGEVEIALSANELAKHVKRSNDYGGSVHFIDWDDVYEMVFRKPIARPSEWHPLARLRCLLGLERRYGYERVAQMFDQ